MKRFIVAIIITLLQLSQGLSQEQHFEGLHTLTIMLNEKIDTISEKEAQLSYIGNVYIGSGGVKAQMQFDTTKDFIATTTTQCITCSNPKYDPTNSTTSILTKADTQNLIYGEATLNGLIYNDKVCMSPGQAFCIPSFDIFGITYQEGFRLQLDGVLGLAPTFPSFVFSLKEQDIIDKGIVSFFFGNSKKQSKVQFGAYDNQYIKFGEASKGLGIHWYHLEEGMNQWKLQTQEVLYGSNRISQNQTQKYCVLDTGSQFIRLPAQDFLVIQKMWQTINPNIICSSLICYITASCSTIMSKAKPFKLKFDDKFYFTLPPSEYLLDGSIMGFDDFCIFGIQGSLNSTQQDIILGNVFLRSFYSIFDYDNRRIALSLHPYSGGVIEGQNFNQWIYTIIVIVGIIVIAVIGICIYKRKQQLKEQKKNDEIQHQWGTALQEGLGENHTPPIGSYNTSSNFNWYMPENNQASNSQNQNLLQKN